MQTEAQEQTQAQADAEELERAARAAVLVQGTRAALPGCTTVRGYDFNRGVDYRALLAHAATTGLQSANLHRAIEITNKMLAWRGAAGERCTLFLGFTSNMASSGLRETLRYLCERRLVHAVVTTAGAVEEDLMKCLADHVLSADAPPDAELRRRGVNRIGNIFVPNDNYCRLEAWVTPLLDELWERQRAGARWTPSAVIDLLGARIADPASICHWCHRNAIPVFCPALTDGALGDMLFFHSFRRPGLVIDIVEDVRRLNTLALRAACAGAVVLGGGLVKHHILNANLMRNGADFAVLVNTAAEFDGSDAGAPPSEALSWGKLRPGAESVKLCAEASLVFPLIVAESFARAP